MKTVYNNKEVAHVWIQQNQRTGKGSNGTLYFNDNIIYSYGGHFPIAKILKDKNVILFTTKSYSNTTAKHKNYVSNAIYGSNYKIIYCKNVDTCLHDDNIKSMIEEIEKTRLSIVKSIKYADNLLNFFNSKIENLKEYQKLFKIKKAPPKAFDRKQAEKILSKQKEVEKIRKQKEENLKQEIKENTIRLLPYWKNNQELPENEKATKTNVNYLGYDCLRVSKDGLNIETSRNATFPVEHAKKAWPLILLAKKHGGWKSNGHTIKMGNYSIDTIDNEGNVKAGCHFVPFLECKEIALKIGCTC